MKDFTIPVSFKFDGYFKIRAEDYAQAVKYINESCGMTLPEGIHSNLPDDIVDWAFSCHGEKIIHLGQ